MDKLYYNLRKDDPGHNKIVIETLIIKFKSQESEEYYELLGSVCDYIYHEKLGSENIKSMLEPFDEEEDLDCVIITLCRDFVTSNDVTLYIVKNLRYLSDIITMLSLAFYKKKDSSYAMIAENLLSCYQYELTNKDIQTLIENLQKYVDDSMDKNFCVMKMYLEGKRKFDFETYEKPYWVSLIDGENISLLSSVPVGETYDYKEIAKYDKLPEFVSGFFHQFVPKSKKLEDDDQSFYYDDLPGNIKESINTFLMVSNESESRESKMKIGTPERVWGPINRIMGEDCCSGPDGKGPCRMLLCECLGEEDNDEGIYTPSEGLTWFHGRCDACNAIIPDISHSIRFPRRHGGWKGCFCSFECLFQEPPYIIEEQENILLNIMKQNINKLGIMDRSSFC